MCRGYAEERKIYWVKLSKVCLSKKKGGLGVKDLALFNKAFVGKWGWRLLMEQDSLWARVVYSKYGHLLEHNITQSQRLQSLWWSDVKYLCLGEEEEIWFKNNIMSLMGNGDLTEFWEHCWVGERPLRDTFPRLHSISLQKELRISEVGFIKRNAWVWNLR